MGPAGLLLTMRAAALRLPASGVDSPAHWLLTGPGRGLEARRCRLSAAAGPEKLGEAEAIRTPCTLTTKTINSVGLSADLVSLIRRRGSVLGFAGEAEDFTLARHCGGLERSCTEVLQKWRYLMQH
jgi:hypothetical protein